MLPNIRRWLVALKASLRTPLLVCQDNTPLLKKEFVPCEIWRDELLNTPFLAPRRRELELRGLTLRDTIKGALGGGEDSEGGEEGSEGGEDTNLDDFASFDGIKELGWDDLNLEDLDEDLDLSDLKFATGALIDASLNLASLTTPEVETSDSDGLSDNMRSFARVSLLVGMKLLSLWYNAT